MTAVDGLSACRSALMEDIEHLRRRRHSAQNGLVGEHIALAGELVAGPVCMALAEALGAPVEARRDAALAVALLELSVIALRELSGEGGGSPLVTANGYPLALNSGDALLSLAHLSLIDLVSHAEGLERESLAGFDTLALAAWTAEAGETDPRAARAVLGQAAGLLAALAAARPELAAALAEFGMTAVPYVAGGDNDGLRQLAASLPLAAGLREKLAAALT